MAVDAKIYFGDCISGMQEEIGASEVDCMVSSIPFGAL
jgi:hypothetical protein